MQVDAGRLAKGWRIQRDTPGDGLRGNAQELRRDWVNAKRYADIVGRSAYVQTEIFLRGRQSASRTS